MSDGGFFSNLISFERERRKKKETIVICKELNIKSKRTFLLKRRVFLVSISILALFLTYFLAEVAYSGIYIHSPTIREGRIWFHEDVDSEGHFNFDPDTGYRLSEKPSRIGVVLPDGTLESIGTMRGNDMGFPDERDFKTPKKEEEIRVAVLGDSFTFSAWMDRSWIEVAEKKINEELVDEEVVLMNFAIDGGGLGNWEAITRNIFLEKDLELDAIIFASFSHNLNRRFHLRHDGYARMPQKNGYKEGRYPHLKMKYVQSWNPEDYPRSIKEVDLGGVEEDGWKIFSTEDVDKIERGEWREDVEIKPYLLNKIIDTLKYHRSIVRDIKNVAHAEFEFTNDNFKEGQIKLMDNIAHDLKELNLPVLVVSFDGEPIDYEMDRRFAEIINSDYVDNLDSEGRRYEHPYDGETKIKNDGHWNQKGAEVFGETMHPELFNWLKERNLINN